MSSGGGLGIDRTGLKEPVLGTSLTRSRTGLEEPVLALTENGSCVIIIG
ncbi:MAG: hypothetical protein L6435_14070 [Anaerolineae bacterium]|nr:hypothetical protein [Anaerolineae bacterium]